MRAKTDTELERHGSDDRLANTRFRSALFVLPVYPSRSDSIDPFWFTAMGLAAALRNHFNTVDVLTPAGLVTEVADAVEPSFGSNLSVFRHLPRPARVFLGDLRAAVRARRFGRVATSLRHRRFDVVFQLHRRFVDYGYRAAASLRVPFVLKVEALETQEEAGWGVTRPGWRTIVESIGERRIFDRADLLLPISTEVDRQLASLGIDADRRHIVASGVDIDLFRPGPPDSDLPGLEPIDHQPRIGWVGGFRPFHGLELVPEFADRIHERFPHAVLYLVGTGPLHARLESEMRQRDWVRLVGAVRHSDVPGWLRSFDVAVVMAGLGPFHYSPLKLYEYLATGCAVVAPDVGDIGREFEHGRDIWLVPPGDAAAVADGVGHLISDPSLRRRLSHAARIKAEVDLSWDARAESIVRALHDRSLV